MISHMAFLDVPKSAPASFDATKTEDVFPIFKR